MSLQKKLLAAHQALPDVLAKDQQRTEGARYRYLNEAGVLPVIRRAFIDAGLTLVVSTTGVDREPAAPRVDKKTGEVHQQQVVTVFLDAIISDPDSDEPPLTVGLAGASICRDGKGLSSARTDALKGIRQALAIAADEPDNDHTQQPAAEPLTHDTVAARARELGYTDEQRDLIISAEGKALPATARRLSDLATEHLQAAVDILSDPAALEYARAHTAEAKAA